MIPTCRHGSSGGGGGEGGTDGGHQGPNSHARAPITLPSPLDKSSVERGLLSLLH